MSKIARVIGMGGVLLAALVPRAGPGIAGPADKPQFVGDAALRGADKGQLDFGRWGSSSSGVKDRAPGVQPRERVRDVLSIVPMGPAKVKEVREMVDNLAKSDPALAARLTKARAGIPASVLTEDMHPIEYLEYVKNLPDNEAKFVMPPPNKIKVVDQAEIARRLALPENAGKAAKDILDNFYKTRKTSIVTHKLTPILQSATVYYPG